MIASSPWPALPAAHRVVRVLVPRRQHSSLGRRRERPVRPRSRGRDARHRVALGPSSGIWSRRHPVRSQSSHLMVHQTRRQRASSRDPHPGAPAVASSCHLSRLGGSPGAAGWCSKRSNPPSRTAENPGGCDLEYARSRLQNSRRIGLGAVLSSRVNTIALDRRLDITSGEPAARQT